MAEAAYPIRTREETADGYIIRLDYGPGGTTTVRVVLAKEDAAQRAQVRAGLNDVLRARGYALAD